MNYHTLSEPELIALKSKARVWLDENPKHPKYLTAFYRFVEIVTALNVKQKQPSAVPVSEAKKILVE